MLGDTESILEYLNYELPEINVLYASDANIDLLAIVEEITRDPWLHYGGFIVVHENESERELVKTLKRVNIIAFIRRRAVSQYLPRVLRILRENRSFLYQRDIHFLLSSFHSGSFEVDNDPFDLNTYSNLLTNFLYNSNLISFEQKDYFHVGMIELLLNAVEHGNCQINDQEKDEWLGSGNDILDLIREKNKDPDIRSRKVWLSYKITPQNSHFSIRDQGAGFDWQAHKTTTGEAGLQESHGRGVAIATLYLNKLSYNEAGNEVSFEIDNILDESNVVPPVFSDMEEVEFQDGDMVFEQGEESTFLYFIVSGRYEILVNNKQIDTLTPDDIFLGEMSFLLNNTRSARVIAAGKGMLIKISKNAFVKAIKDSPHYGIFLARLLAQRLVRLHGQRT